MNPIEFLLFKISFDTRWPFSEISGKRTPSRNIFVGGHPDSFHLHWLASDCEFDLEQKPDVRMRAQQKKYCKRQGVQIIHRPDTRYFHIEPDI
jgi:hypothetical protein